MGDRESKASGILGTGVTSILRNLVFLLGSNWLAMGLRGIYVVILARALGPAGYGLISSRQALYLILVVAVTAGLPGYLSRERAAVGTRETEAVRLSLIVQLGALSLGAIAFLLFAVLSESDPEARTVFALSAGAMVARGLAIYVYHT